MAAEAIDAFIQFYFDLFVGFIIIDRLCRAILDADQALNAFFLIYFRIDPDLVGDRFYQIEKPIGD